MTMGESKVFSRDQEGFILITVLWLVALVSVLVMGALQEWRTELKLAANFQAKSQCRRLAEGGVYYGLGKILEKEMAVRKSDNEENKTKFWLTDGGTNVVELPGSRIEIAITDEAGKLNLETTSQESLHMLFDAWGYPIDRVRNILQAISNWRAGTTNASDSCPSLPQKNFMANTFFPFDSVEEILWLSACSGLNPKRLSDCLTVQQVEGGINLNAASSEVLKALGFSETQIHQVLEARSAQPLQNFQDLLNVVDASQIPDLQSRISFQSSVFYTIFSTGMVDYSKSKHTVKAIVRLELGKPNLWSILYWADDYPGDAAN
jgi:type II secretory pathway component PulK